MAKFLFAGIEGVITAWSTGTSAQVVADRSSQDAEYVGLAMASNAGANFLYATNFKAAQASTLYFASGPGDEEHDLVGTIKVK